MPTIADVSNNNDVFSRRDFLMATVAGGTAAVTGLASAETRSPPTAVDLLIIGPAALRYATVTAGSRRPWRSVDGKIVMKDREFLTVDIEKLRADVKQRYPRMIDRYERAIQLTSG